ncbi:MAG: Tol-Pal system protein TolB [Porticoccaceae bacterium]|nr:Tol-Pal system protein TolB [Porticoccaceae bacterium]MBT7963032.1 Tol-Pal system protein TolB [Porticoccaceae bacterium]
MLFRLLVTAKTFHSIAVVMVLVFTSVAAWGELVIRVTQGNDKPTIIAVAPMSTNGIQVLEDISAIVESDLLRSGLFKIIPRQNMLAFPQNADDVYYRDWRLLGSEYLVVGGLKDSEGKIELSFSLLDVTSQKTVFKHRVTGTEAQIRDLAHLVSDKVYKEITGIRGIFSTRLAYVTAELNDDKFIYRLNVSDSDGAREQLVLESTQPIMSPSWSPKGDELAYVSFETGRPAIWRQRLVGGQRIQLTNFSGLNGAPSWAPDGNKLALVLSKDGNPEIYLLDLTSNKLSRLTRHFAIDTEPTWTPDGKSLLFTSDRGGTPQIYKLTIASKVVERITFKGNYNARPSLAPDGRTLVVVHRESSVFHIATLDLKTGRMLELTETRLDESPTVAPNGAMLIYATKQGGRGVLSAVSLDAGVKYFLPAKIGDVREPAWSPFLR